MLSWQAEARSGALLVHDFRPDAEEVLAYLQSLKKLELKPVPFLKKPADPPTKKTT